MASRSSVFVNARVHLPGAASRGAVVSHNVEYIATRRGADRSATPDDLRRAELAERMGLAGYYAERPGSTALFDQDGAVPLREARRRLKAAEGSLATWVVSVRREEARELNLADKAEWERYCRANLTQALAEAMGVPESSVRWVAAEHENAEASKHVHVISWSSDGSFDGLMARRDLERARAMLTDAGLAPAMRVELAARDEARSRAVEAARHVGREEIGVELPPEGRISYAHLRRWHPDAARQVMRSLDEAARRSPELESAASDYRAAVGRMADLKGLGGEGRDRYIAKAMGELRSRQANALLRTIAPDRTEPAAASGPASPGRTTGPRPGGGREGPSIARCGHASAQPPSSMPPSASAGENPSRGPCSSAAPPSRSRRQGPRWPSPGRSPGPRRRAAGRPLTDDAGARAARAMGDILMAAASAALVGDPKSAATAITKAQTREVTP